MLTPVQNLLFQKILQSLHTSVGVSHRFKSGCIILNILPHSLQRRFTLNNSVCFAVTWHPVYMQRSRQTLCIPFSHVTSVINTLRPLDTSCNNSACFINSVLPLQTLGNLRSRCSFSTSTRRCSSRSILLPWQTVPLNYSRICTLCLLHKQPMWTLSLHRIQQCSHLNQMPSEKLACVFSSCLFQTRGQTPQEASVVQDLISNYILLFSVSPALFERLPEPPGYGLAIISLTRVTSCCVIGQIFSHV